MIESPLFWIMAIIAVIVTGISKGGFGGLGLLAVPLMSLSISPLQAAGIMLPILIVMDWIGVWSYRKTWDKRLLMLMLPAALIGIGAGWSLARFVNEDMVLACVGIIAITFAAYSFLKSQTAIPKFAKKKSVGVFAGIVAGFTSFVAHAGGPPFQAYAIPQNLEKQIYAGTAVMFFTVVNAAKIIPYAALGQFDKTNLTTSLVLIPLAPIGVLTGVWLVKRVPQKTFYNILYVIIFAVGVKLLWDVWGG